MVKTLLPLQIAGTLRPEVAKQVDEHLMSCAACRMILAELKANQAEAGVDEKEAAIAQAAPLSKPLEVYRQNAGLTRAQSEVASATDRDTKVEPRPMVERRSRPRPELANDPPTTARSTGRERPATSKASQQVASEERDIDHLTWRSDRDPRSGVSKLRNPAAVAQTIFTVVMVVLALMMGLSWRGAGLRLEAYQQEVTAGAINELQADLKLIKAQLQSPGNMVAFPVLTRETLAMSLLLKSEPLYQESYLPLIEAYSQIQSALVIWRGEQSSAPPTIISGFVKEVGQATDHMIQVLEPLKGSWPPSADQRAALKQSVARLQGLAVSYIDEGIIPGQIPEATVSEQAAIASAATLLPEGGTPVKPAAVRRYHRRLGTDLWEVSFTHQLQQWRVEVDAVSGQVVGMMLPVPNKGEQVSLEQAEQTVRTYLANRIQADDFALVDRQEKEGQVLFTAQRVIDGLRYFADPIKVGVARYGGTITTYQRVRPGVAWTETPVYQLTAEQAKELAATWAAGQKIATPSEDGTLGVALHPSHQERLVWGFATKDPQVILYVDAQSGETWRSP